MANKTLRRLLILESNGSTLPLAIFALALLSGMGILLLFVGQGDVRSGQVGLRVKTTFYKAEAALEDGREELRQWNIASASVTLDEELLAAAGPNGIIDFDPDLAEPIYDASGTVTGFTNVGDDRPLRPLTAFEDGAVAAYLMNDPSDGRTSLVDTNLRLAVTGLAVGPRGSFEKVEAVVRHLDPFPPFGAAITILGQNPYFWGGTSNVKLLTGNNCNQPSPPAPTCPVVGVIGPAAEAIADTGVVKPLTFVEGAETGVDTVDDISGTIAPEWTNCQYLRDLAKMIEGMAEIVGDANTPKGDIGTPANPKIVFIQDDYDLKGNFHGAGILWVTKKLRLQGTVKWNGIIFVVGDGEVERYGAGNGYISGGAIVANISGPDRILFTGDDCAGTDGVVGTADDGIADGGSWDVAGSGTGDTIYCDTDIDLLKLRWPFKPEQFRQM
ncbi:MAG: hypothetical protein OEQ13_00550 [Acidobacteriota bacterium]|nr:hypothetical protein [Acidobacteriota bacterium]